MKLLIIGRGYPTEKYKLNGIFEFDQAKTLKAAGHDVCFLAIDLRSVRRFRKFGLEKRLIDGVTVYAVNLPIGNIPKQIRLKLSSFALKYAYKRILKEWGKPDLVHAHFITIGAVAVDFFKEQTDIPVVVTEHSSKMNQDSVAPFYHSLAKNSYSKADRVIAVSSYLARQMEQRYKVKVAVVPNVVDLKSFQANLNETKNRVLKDKSITAKDDIEKEFQFISVGRLSVEKRFDLMIESFAQAFPANPKVKLIIFGDGPEREKLENLIKTLELNQRVILKGFVNRNEIALAMREAQVFVLTSHLETFGLAAIEALAMGLPVLTTNSGGPEDYINETNGILLEEDSVDSISQGFQEMKNYIRRYESDQIARDIIEKYSRETIAEQLKKIYLDTLQQF